MTGGTAQGQRRREKAVTILETSHGAARLRTKPVPPKSLAQGAPRGILSPQRFATPGDTDLGRALSLSHSATSGRGSLFPTGVLIFFKTFTILFSL